MNLQKLKKVMKAPKDSTLTRINEFLVAQYNQPVDYVQKHGHKPSSLGSDCLRKIYYEYFKLDKETDVDVKGAKIFDMGDAVEGMVMRWLKGIGEHIPYRNKGNGQIPISRFTGKPDPQFPITIPEWRIPKGKIDNVGVSGGDLWLYEIKSSASHKFTPLEQPMDDHIVQNACYFKGFNEHLAKGDYAHVPELKDFTKAVGVKFIYVNKDNTDVKIFALKESELNGMVESLGVRVKKVNAFADSKTLPEKTEGNCTYCPYQNRCQSNRNV